MTRIRKAPHRYRQMRDWLVTFWAGPAHRRKEIDSIPIKADSRRRAIELAQDRRPKDVTLVTVAAFSQFGRRQGYITNPVQRLRDAEIGAIFWELGSGHEWSSYASRAGRRIERIVYYAFPFHQTREGDDVAAVERVRLCRIRVMGDRPGERGLRRMQPAGAKAEETSQRDADMVSLPDGESP